jgi:hypothetical protein
MWKLDRPTMCEMKAKAAHLVNTRLHGFSARLEVRYHDGRKRARADVLLLRDGEPFALVDITKSDKAPVSAHRARERTGLPVMAVPGYRLYDEGGGDAFTAAILALYDRTRVD